MTIEKLTKEMIAAMKAGDKARKSVISTLVEAVKKAAIDANCRDNITESMVDTVILKEQKTVQEMIDTCPVEREDLCKEYKYRLSVISEFAPVLMSENEIKEFVIATATEKNIELNIKQKGNIMKNIMPLLKGKADGKLANNVITELLK